MLRIETGGSPYGARLVTDRPYRQGELICAITGYRVTHQATYQTVQIGPDTHIEELGVLAYLNHSCRPNTIVDTTAMEVRAARDIAAGEELTFFYPSTEWEMDRPFICLCGAPQCVRLVAGAKYLSIDTLSRYFINRHIRDMALAALDQALCQAITEGHKS
ncbi:MAG: SET domain-containing protein-lysine N-methyltransferase [Anaerolineae bacterium]|nr:SET domain-containing protein-lysine N-methyltransferase [Thermoflexales bacterium]MDW8406404.1 SET domain-containing protein-lysine N-methyltransferase [Anaerolineae bacterium]